MLFLQVNWFIGILLEKASRYKNTEGYDCLIVLSASFKIRYLSSVCSQQTLLAQSNATYGMLSFLNVILPAILLITLFYFSFQACLFWTHQCFFDTRKSYYADPSALHYAGYLLFFFFYRERRKVPPLFPVELLWVTSHRDSRVVKFFHLIGCSSGVCACTGPWCSW